MASPCTEGPTRKDIEAIRSSIEAKENRMEEAKRRYARGKVDGKTLETAGDKYRITTNREKIDKICKKQGETTKRRRKEQRSFPKKSPAQEKRGGKINQDIGSVGEYVGNRITALGLGLEPVPYDKPRRTDIGPDAVFRNPDNGKLVMVECKLTEDLSGYGRRSLSSTKHGKQLSQEWVEEKAREMREREAGTELYSKTNAEIGKEIEKAGAENVQTLLVHVHPQSFNVTVSQPGEKISWEPLAVFEYIPNNDAVWTDTEERS